jgi:hypothetical protein
VRVANQPVRVADPKHQEASEKHQKHNTARAITDPADHFPTFWSAYPRKVAKPKAQKEFDRLKVNDELLAVMLAAVSREAKSEQWSKDAGRFIPHPATWLHNRRWEDGEGATTTADDSRPTWATSAGFANRYEAENAGCFERNATSFSAGKRITRPASQLEPEGAV